MLEPHEAHSLVNVLNECADMPLARASQNFRATFSDEISAFRAATALCVMLRDALLAPPQRLVALFSIAELNIHRHMNVDPFLPILLSSIDAPDPAAPHAERNFASFLLNRHQNKLNGMSATSFMASYDTQLELPEGNIQELRDCLLERNVDPLKLLPMDSLCISPSIEFQSHFTDSSTSAATSTTDLRLDGFGPTLSCPHPPRVPPSFSHMHWIDLQRDLQLEWDYSVCADTARASEIQDLMMRALKEPLQPSNVEQFDELLQEDVKLVFQSGLSPKNMPELIERNPKIALKALLVVVPSIQKDEYLAVLVSMETTPNSVKVITELALDISLPKEFVRLYATNCIASLEKVKDKYLQTRLVRLLCVFLTSLIRTRIIKVQDLFIEVQAFCIDFSRIREAAHLFRLLKTLETPGHDGGDADDVPDADEVSTQQ